jgi:hypothetical protein
MTVMIDRIGRFRGTIREYYLTPSAKADSKSVGLFLEFLVEECWDTESKSWVDWRDSDVVANGWKYIIGRDGQLSTRAVEEVIEATGWDGNIRSIAEAKWTPAPCQFTITEEEYNGEKRYKLGFLNPWDSEGPSGGGRVDLAGVKALEAQYGAQLRALAASKKRNASPAPAGKPSSPKPAAPPVPPAATSATADDDVPF